MMGIRLRFVDHTADVGFELDAPTRGTLFEGAAYGLAQLATGADAWPPARSREVTHEEEIEVRTTGGGDEALLAEWLRELVYHIATKHAVPRRVRLSIQEADRLRAQIGFTDAAAIVREIKGVTWHGLEVKRDDDRWHARVIFDV